MTSSALATAHPRATDDNGAEAVPMLMLTLEQAKAVVNLSEDTLRGVMRSGALPSVLIGRARRIRMADLQHWVAGLPPSAA